MSAAPTAESVRAPLSPFVVMGRLFLVAAIGLSLYLGVTSLVNGAVAGCGEGAGCQQVLASKWAYALGIPISLLGAGAYLAFLIADYKRCCAWFSIACGAAIVGAAIYFFIIQAAVVKQFCPWCCVTHFLAILGVLFLVLAHRRHYTGSGWGPVALAAGGLAALVVAQILGPDVKTTEGASLGNSGVQVAPVDETSGRDRTITLHEGKFTIDVNAYPAIGDPATAEHVAVGLFDWTCPHCRHLTETFTQIQKEFGSRLALVQLPGCFNEKGCVLQRLMMSVWRAQPEFFEELAHLVHSEAVKAVEADVRELLNDQFGSAQVRAWEAEHSPWAQEQLDMAQAIRTANKEIVNSTRFPQLMLGDYIETGSDDNPGHYYELLRKHFGLARSAIPQISANPSSIALGTMVVGAPHAFQFDLSNPGKEPVEIQRVQLPSGMRLVEQPSSLAPGGTVTLSVSLLAPLAPTTAALAIVINSNAEPSALQIPVIATVIKPYAIDPFMLNFGDFTKDDQTMTSVLTFEQPVKLGDPRPNSPEYGVRLVEVEPGKHFELHVKAKPDREKLGWHMGIISIPVTTESAEIPWPHQLQIRVRGRVPPKPAPAAPAAPKP